MRRTKVLFLAAGLGALLATSIAAASFTRRAQTADVSATFMATASRVDTRTCEGEGGTMFRITNAVWRGTSTSTEPRLAGNLVLRTRSVVNIATGDGWLNGSWQTRAAPPPPPAKQKPRGGRLGSNAGLTAVIDNAVQVNGLATGRVHRPWGHLRGNFSAAIAGEQIAGALGVNAPVAPDNSAIIFRTGCR